MSNGELNPAIAHDSTKIRYEVHGRGDRFILFGFPLIHHAQIKQGYIDRLGAHYRLIFVDLTSEPHLYTLTAGALVHDILQAADAAGADEFAYFGYSWGATMGLQLALRSDRAKALILGGFPMLDGPYEEIRETLRYSVAKMATKEERSNWPHSRQVLTYYESLMAFDDNLVQDQVLSPRINFIGEKDTVVFPGDVVVNFADIFRAREADLKKAGWTTIILKGRDHGDALDADIVLQHIGPWLNENWPSKTKLTC